MDKFCKYFFKGKIKLDFNVMCYNLIYMKFQNYFDCEDIELLIVVLGQEFKSELDIGDYFEGMQRVWIILGVCFEQGDCLRRYRGFDQNEGYSGYLLKKNIDQYIKSM